jgi:DNA-binding MarR family transcriptional regulator
MMMNVARESIELLGQIARVLWFEGTKHGLRDREWTALRFLVQANRFSRTPSALASYIGTTKGTASLIINKLEKLAYLERKPSANDKRSVTLGVTPRGKKVLARDPINALVDTIAVLDDVGKASFRDALRHVLDQSDTTQQRRHADICKRCMFLTEDREDAEDRTSTVFTCRLFCAAIAEPEIELLCTSFERRRH